MARSRTLAFQSGLALIAALAMAGCAGNRPEPGDAQPAAEPAADTGEAEPSIDNVNEHFDDPAPGDSPTLTCSAPAFKEDDTELLDKSQVRIEQLVYGTSRWFDGLFGTSTVECAGIVSKGYVGAGIRWDERDGAKFRARFRARVALPALSKRARLIIGRGDADRYIEGTDDKNVQNLPERFNDFGEQDFLIGLGFGRSSGLRKGWDFGAGVKFSTPIDPYVRARYFTNPIVSERLLWRTTPQLFWQESRGWGVSVSNSVDYSLHENWLLRSWTSLVEDEESEGLDWVQQFTAYQNLNKRSAISYSVYATGETQNEVPLLDYGVEVRYRRSILREWFYIELRTSLSWPREFLEEIRESNIGLGIEFEMQFGEWPNRD